MNFEIIVLSRLIYSENFLISNEIVKGKDAVSDINRILNENLFCTPNFSKMLNEIKIPTVHLITDHKKLLNKFCEEKKIKIVQNNEIVSIILHYKPKILILRDAKDLQTKDIQIIKENINSIKIITFNGFPYSEKYILISIKYITGSPHLYTSLVKYPK